MIGYEKASAIKCQLWCTVRTRLKLAVHEPHTKTGSATHVRQHHKVAMSKHRKYQWGIYHQSW